MSILILTLNINEPQSKSIETTIYLPVTLIIGLIRLSILILNSDH